MSVAVSVPVDAGAQDLIYKVAGEQGIALTFLPPLTVCYEKAPVYFLISGGGWYMENRESMLNFFPLTVKQLRERGFAVVSVDYRVTEMGPHITVEEEISDVMDAARYLARYADVLKIDPQHIVVSGHSAGGHLTLMMAWAPHDLFRRDSVLTEDFTVVGCVPLSPAVAFHGEVTAEPLINLDVSHIYAGHVYDDAVAHRCSPYDYITAESVPTLLVHGSHDDLLSPENARLAYAKGKRLGADFDLLMPQNGGHCYECKVEGETTFPGVDSIQRFVTAWVLKLLEEK